MNTKKTRYTLFHKNYSKDEIPLKLPHLNIENLDIERNSTIHILLVMLNEHINLKDHITIEEFEIAKNIDLLNVLPKY